MKRAFKTKLVSDIKKKRCKYCLDVNNLTYDHKVPLILGGKNDVKNIQVLCKWCNGNKSGMTDGQVRQLAKWLAEVNRKRLLKGKCNLN